VYKSLDIKQYLVNINGGSAMAEIPVGGLGLIPKERQRQRAEERGNAGRKKAGERETAGKRTREAGRQRGREGEID